MPDAQQVIIEFVSDASGLQPAEDRLAALGSIDAKSAVIFKNTNTELAKRQALLTDIAAGSQQVVLSATKEQTVYNKLVSSLKDLSGQSKVAVQSLLAMRPDQVAAGFDNAAISVDDYVKSLETAGEGSSDLQKQSSGLRAELISLTKQIAQARLTGQDTGAEFQDLVNRAGEIKSSLQQAGKAVNAFANEERGIGNLVGSVRALGGAFETTQAAIALFGGQNKDLEEVLIRLNGTMALLAGIQEIQQALSKEGAITVGLLVAQEKLAVLQTTLLTAAESENVVVSALATIGIRALNAAMAANPIGLLITAIVAVVAAFAFFINKAHDAAVAQGELNQAIKNGSEGLDAYVQGSKRGLDQVVSDLEKANARQSDIQKQGGLASADIINKRKEQIEELNKVIIKNEDSTNKETVELREKAETQKFQLEQKNADDLVQLHVQQNAYDKQLIEENLQDRIDAGKKVLVQAQEGSKAQLAAQIALIRAQAALDINDAGQDPSKVAAIQAQAAKDVFEAQVSYQKRIADLRLQDVNTQIENADTVDATLQEKYVLELKRISAQTAADLLNTKLSVAEKKEINAKADADRLAAGKAFNEADRKQTLEAEIDRNKVILDARNTSSADQLTAQVANIELAAQIEVDATKNNAAKVKQIYAQRDKDIRDARLASIQKELADELSLDASNNGPVLRSAELQQEKLDELYAKRKISASGYYNYTVILIKSNTQTELDENQKQIDALNEELKEKLISQKDYNLQYAALADARVKIEEDASKKIADAAKKVKEQQKKDNEDIATFAVQTAGQVGDLILDALQSNIDQQTAKLDFQKQQIQDLQTQGRITDKEASDRLAQLARQEAKIKHDQAVKDKEAAIFNATINTAEAVIKAYSTTGPIAGVVLAAIVGAIGAAQIALIASRPIPQFFTGKKPNDKYEGYGSVAEHGSELIQREDGSMHVQKKKDIIWLGKNDIVYTNDETRRMLSARPTMRKQQIGNVTVNNKLAIDYDKIGQSVAKHAKTNVFVDGVLAQEIEQTNHTKYLNARRKYK